MPRVKEPESDDPDPTPYLFVSLEQKRIDQSKPYDAKKACWVPDEKDGYVLGEIKGTKGDIVSVTIGTEVTIILLSFIFKTSTFLNLLIPTNNLCSKN